MSNPRISIAKLKQLIQLQSSHWRTREVARALSLSQGAVSKYSSAVRAAGLTWEQAQTLDEAELEKRIWQARAERPTHRIVLPDCAWIHTELKRHKHVTLQLLWDEPELQRSYEEMAAHFSIAVIPARPFRPRDKPKAELTVLWVCRWILARLRHQRFFSLDELNAAIRPLLNELNERPFQKLSGSRRSVFEALDRPAMRPLPATPYIYAEWKRVRAAFDYHVEVDRHYYSVPHALVGQELWARFSAATIDPSSTSLCSLAAERYCGCRCAIASRTARDIHR